MASNRLADNYREDGVARPYTRRPIDYELSNLLDDVPEHLELCFDFALDVIAEREPQRFFLHRYLSQWCSSDQDSFGLDYPKITEKGAVRFMTHPDRYAFSTLRGMDYGMAEEDAEAFSGDGDRHRGMRPSMAHTVEPFFRDPFARTIIFEWEEDAEDGYLGNGYYYDVVQPDTLPTDAWLHTHKLLAGADPDWVRAGACYVVARAITKELAALRIKLEDEGVITPGEELRPMLLNSNIFTHEVVGAVTQLLHLEGLRSCVITPREFPTFETYDAPVKETDTPYVASAGKEDAIMFAMGMSGVTGHSDQCLERALAHARGWYDGRWMLPAFLPSLTLPNGLETVRTDVMRMQAAMNEIHYNEEHAANTLLAPFDADNIYFRLECDDVVKSLMEPYCDHETKIIMFHAYSVPAGVIGLNFCAPFPRAQAIQYPRKEHQKHLSGSVDAHHGDHSHLYLADPDRDEWRYRICRMFYTMEYRSRHFTDLESENALRRRIFEFNTVLKQFRDRSYRVYRKMYPKDFVGYESYFDQDPLSCSTMPSDVPPGISALFRNIALLNRLIAQTATQ